MSGLTAMFSRRAESGERSKKAATRNLMRCQTYRGAKVAGPDTYSIAILTTGRQGVPSACAFTCAMQRCYPLQGAQPTMKRVLALLSLLAIVATFLVACGSSTSGGSGKVTVNWWHISTTDPLKSAWQDLANQYMAAHPNV